MKYIITEKQSRLLEEPEKILRIPSLKYFNDNWNLLQKFLERRGYPAYSISGDLDLSYKSIESLGNLEYVWGDLNLRRTPIKSLGNLKHVGGYLNLFQTPIESLGDLKHVGGYLGLVNIPIKTLGNLKHVGGDLYLKRTPLSKTMSEDEIRSKVNVEGSIYL